MKKNVLLLMLFFTTALMFAQSRKISGTITDEDTHVPIIGASIMASGTSIGTVTDVEGNYTLNIPQGSTLLLVSFTGYASREIPIGTSNIINVSLQTAEMSLGEVVVVGYGTQIKSTLTGNISKVEGEDIQDIPVASVEQALQGRSAGVFVESVNGKPGGAVRVRIRGAASITASSQPLYVVDGVPVSVEPLNTSGAYLNPLADLNPNDIQSVEILKDASAGAIYGSRAANGVILITTKKGKAGKTTIEANFQTGTSSPTGRREFLNRDQYIQLVTRSVTGAATYEYALDPSAWTDEQEAIDWYVDNWATARFNRYSGPDVTDYTTTNTNTDWQEEAFANNPISTLASLSATGGNDKTKYYASAAWNRQEGVLLGNNFERLSARLNLDQVASRRINFGINMSLSQTFTDQVSGDNAFSTPLQMVALAPITPTRDENGVLYDRPTTTYYNGLIDFEEAKRDVTSFRTLANAYIRWELADALFINGEIGADIYTLKDNAFYGSLTDGGGPTNGYATSVYAQVTNITPKVYLNYNTSFSEAHHLAITGGMEYQKSRTDRTRVEGGEFPVDDLKTLASAANITVGTSTISEFSFLSYFARANYDFNRKYLLSVSARMDGSSRFGENNRYGFFPAVSAGWVLTEDFLADNNLISFLKIWASYGQTGNAAIGDFRHLGLYDANGYAGQSGLAPSQIPNPDLEWEKTNQTDIGLNFGLFDNRLNGEIDYYIKNTTGLLLDVPVPATTGFTTQTKNIGEIENKGWEFVINSNILVKEFKWNLGLNVAINKNKVVSLADDQDLIDNGATNVVKVGESIGVFYGAEYAGVDPANGDALWYKNGEGTGRETTNDYSQAEYVVMGNPNPDFIGGITNSFAWKGLSLDVLFQGVFGNEIYNEGAVYMSCQSCWYDNQTADQMNYWDKPGDITDVPEPRFWYNNGAEGRNSRYISDGSYLRLKNLTLAYELPKSTVDKVGLSRLRIYLMGENLLTFTKYEGWDPEVSSDDFTTNVISGVDFYSAPQPKTIAFGVNIGF